MMKIDAGQVPTKRPRYYIKGSQKSLYCYPSAWERRLLRLHVEMFWKLTVPPILSSEGKRKKSELIGAPSWASNENKGKYDFCSIQQLSSPFSYVKSDRRLLYFPWSTHLLLLPRSKNAWSYTSTPKCASMAWCSVKAQGQLYLFVQTHNNLHTPHHFKSFSGLFKPQWRNICRVSALNTRCNGRCQHFLQQKNKLYFA